MPLINCEVEFKLKWAKYCALPAACADNIDTNSNNIIFTIKDTKLYVSVITLSAENNQKLSKIVNKWFERSVYWNECKTKSENKSTTNEYKYFLESNFVVINILSILVYANQDVNAKRFQTRRYYLPKGIIDNYDVIINGKNFCNRTIYSNIKRF